LRFKFTILIFVIVSSIIIYRLFDLTVISHNHYRELSSSNIIKNENIAPVRGEILDRNGKLLALNRMGFKISIRPHLSKAQLKEAVFLLKKSLNIDSLKIIENYQKKNLFYNNKPIKVISFVEYQRVMPHYTRIDLHENIEIEPTYKRFYPYDYVASHIVGYVAKTNRKEAKNDKTAKLNGFIGKSGIEKFYNSYLQGKRGFRTIKVTALNREVEVLNYKQALQNRDIKLSIDIELQQYLSKIFRNISAVDIIMKNDGEILGLGSYPEYNPNSFVKGLSSKEWNRIKDDIRNPFTNKAVNGLYPPASTVKGAVGLSFLNSEKIGIDTYFHCDSNLKVGKRVFRCWKGSGHGETNLNKAIRESCDDYFYKGSLQVGIDNLSKDLKRYGFGQKTGIDLPNEFIGTMPDRQWKKRKHKSSWYIGETLNTSIGQGYLLSTPIQIAQITALIATGKRVRPHFTEVNRAIIDILTDDEVKNLSHIQKAMWEVANHKKGTATKHLKLNSGIEIAGKTGTAQVISIPQNVKQRLNESEMAIFKRSHSWFTTYAPYKEPKFIVTVLLEHGGHGGKSVSPYISKIYNKLQEMGYL